MKRIIQILIIALLSIPCIIIADNKNGVNCNQGDKGGDLGHPGDSIPQDSIPPIPGDSTKTPVAMPIDPNEIIGVKGYDSLQWVKVTDQLAYTIYFENDPKFATAAAQKVGVRYAFDKKADMYSFGLGSFGFGSFIFAVENAPTVYQKRLDVRDSLGIYVDVVAGLDVVKKEAFWILSSIDPETGLPPLEVHKGFLPVNDKEKHNGEGFVSFVMKPKEDCVTEDSILAQAAIVFDTNDAISTNVWKNTIDAKAPTSKLIGTQDPADNTHYLFRFEAADDKKGSGLKSITVYLSQNKEAYKEIAVCAPDSVLSFTAASGAEYAFYSIAVDNTGNVEGQKQKPDYLINSNTAPTDVILSDTLFADDIAAEEFIGELSTVDSEETQEFTYALAEGDGAIHNDLFLVKGSQLQAGSMFKCAADTVYHIRINTTDIGGLSFEKAFTLHLQKVLPNPVPDTLAVQICQGDDYDFYGTTYNQSGYYTYAKGNEYACDSVYVLDLRVNPYPLKPTVTFEGTHTLVSSALNGNQWYDEHGAIDGANSRSYTPESTGIYCVTTSNGTCESEPSDVLFVNLSDQTQLNWDLSKDWNWISVNTSGATDTRMLFEPVQNGFDRIVGYDNELINDPEYGFAGGLAAMSAENAYKLSMKENAALELNGIACLPAEIPVRLSKGWNWIGYLPIVDLSLEVALSELQADNGDVIKGLNDFAMFDGAHWTGSLTSLKPGEGYMYSSGSSKEFRYSSVRVSLINQAAERAAMAPSESPWTLNEHKYPNNMTMIASLYQNGAVAEAGIFTVGAFCGKECRGIGKYVDGKLFITIHGREPGESISFRAMENAMMNETDISEKVSFGETMIGSLKQPFKLNLLAASMTTLDNPAITIYPNPVREHLYIGGEIPGIKNIQVLNTSGSSVLRVDGYSKESGVDVSSLADGSYIIAINTDEGMLYRKFIKSAVK